jgi:hypothetical protein
VNKPHHRAITFVHSFIDPRPKPPFLPISSSAPNHYHHPPKNNSVRVLGRSAVVNYVRVVQATDPASGKVRYASGRVVVVIVFFFFCCCCLLLLLWLSLTLTLTLTHTLLQPAPPPHTHNPTQNRTPSQLHGARGDARVDAAGGDGQVAVRPLPPLPRLLLRMIGGRGGETVY